MFVPDENATSPATRVVERLLNLDSLERQGEWLSIQVNHCYFSIGESYRLFAEVRGLRKNAMPRDLAKSSRGYLTCQMLAKTLELVNHNCLQLFVLRHLFKLGR
jgi:hypothetical protein